MSKISKEDILKVQVSSVVRNDKNFGKHNIFDGCDDTCWSSDEGSQQWVYLELKDSHTISSFNIQFQGGFVGDNCRIEFTSNEGEVTSEPFYPEDNNSVQKFSLSKPMSGKKVKFVFEGSTDFFGRVIIYSIELHSDKLS